MSRTATRPMGLLPRPWGRRCCGCRSGGPRLRTVPRRPGSTALSAGRNRNRRRSFMVSASSEWIGVKRRPLNLWSPSVADGSRHEHGQPIGKRGLLLCREGEAGDHRRDRVVDGSPDRRRCCRRHRTGTPVDGLAPKHRRKGAASAAIVPGFYGIARSLWRTLRHRSKMSMVSGRAPPPARDRRLRRVLRGGGAPGPGSPR